MNYNVSNVEELQKLESLFAGIPKGDTQNYMAYFSVFDMIRIEIKYPTFPLKVWGRFTGMESSWSGDDIEMEVVTEENGFRFRWMFKALHKSKFGFSVLDFPQQDPIVN